VLRSAGPFALIHGFIDVPPHSPISTLIGAVSFALSGSASFAPYLANGLLLGAVLGFLVHRLSAPLAPSLGILICVALLPLTDWAIMTFRPDIMAGIVTAVAGGTLLLSDLRTMQRSTAALFGACGGLCLLYKPTAVMPTGALLIASAGMATLKAWPDRRVISLLAIMGAAGLLISLPYFIPVAGRLIDYIRFALLQNTSITGLQGGWIDQISFYPTQAGQMFGRIWWAALAVMAVAIIVCRGERLTLLCFAAITAVAYIIPTIPVVKTVMFGAYFYGAVLICLIAALGMLARRAPRSMMIVIAALIGMQLAERREDQPAIYPPLMKAYRTIALRTYKAFTDPPLHGIVKFYVGFPWPLGQGALELKSLQENRPFEILSSPNIIHGYFGESLQPYIDDLKRSDVALIPSAELASHFFRSGCPRKRFWAMS